MIQKSVAFALQNRFLVLCAGILLLVWGAISFKHLPVEAYPDVANNYVEVITQWPGISAEQIEQQVTIPLEIVMNGIPHLTSLRSVSVFGLSVVCRKRRHPRHRHQSRRSIQQWLETNALDLCPRSYLHVPKFCEHVE